MRRLERLLQARIIFNDDILYFSFKKHIFTGKIVQGGLIWNCTWQKPGDSPKEIFKNQACLGQQPYIRTFESLTDWTETCIQECLDEYHTRYSSWKRVRHKRSDQPMEVLFKHLQRRQMTPNDPKSKSILLFEQLASQKGHIAQLTEHIRLWMKWYQGTHPGEPLPIESLVPTRLGGGQDGETPQTSEGVQPFLMHSDEGQYVVLHRLNEVAPQECVSWLQQNGPESFKKRLEGIKLCLEPNSAKQQQWEPVDKNTCRQFLHDFFKH